MCDKEAEEARIELDKAKQVEEARAREAEANAAATEVATAETAATGTIAAETAKDQSDRAYDDAVKAILTTFGVFTGFAIKAAFDTSKIKLPEASASWWGFLDLLKSPDLFTGVAVVALLLRFILGSAVHLNLNYATEPRYKHFAMLFKDLGFLVVFGLFAVLMIEAPTVQTFEIRASWFILVGSIWSLLDLIIRGVPFIPPQKAPFSARWMGIDALQLILILLVWNLDVTDLTRSMFLAAGFTLALLGDMWVILPDGRAPATSPTPPAGRA